MSDWFKILAEENLRRKGQNNSKTSCKEWSKYIAQHQQDPSEDMELTDTTTTKKITEREDKIEPTQTV